MQSLFALALAVMAATLPVAADLTPERAGKTRSVGRTFSLKTVRKMNTASDVPSGLVQHARGSAKRWSAIPEVLANAPLRRTTRRL
jgi:hypothetical protein